VDEGFPEAGDRSHGANHWKHLAKRVFIPHNKISNGVAIPVKAKPDAGQSWPFRVTTADDHRPAFHPRRCSSP